MTDMKHVLCPDCGGTGWKDQATAQAAPCQSCGGRGIVRVVSDDD